MVRPGVTRVERYAAHCPCCGGVALAPVPVGMEEGSPFSANIVALAIYLPALHDLSRSQCFSKQSSKNQLGDLKSISQS